MEGKEVIVDTRHWSIKPKEKLFTVAPELKIKCKLVDRLAIFREPVIIKDEFDGEYCDDVFNVTGTYVDHNNVHWIKVSGNIPLRSGSYYVLEEVE